MNQKSFITGKGLVCALGKISNEIIKNLKQINNNNYPSFLDYTFSKRPFYSINDFPDNTHKRFFSILEHAIDEAIKEADLSLVQQEELHIFIGSTSMGISMNEQTNKSFNQNNALPELSHVGYGHIGSFIEKHLNSKHKSTIFSTACTSSVNALSHASKLIKHSKIKRAIIIGIELFNESTFKGFSSLMLLSESNIYRPFDKNSDGIILGEACSAIIIENSPRKKDNFQILSTSNVCDNYSETTSNPSGEPIFNAMNQCLKEANLTPKDLTCIKAHATGSENNNTSEANALKQLFELYQEKTLITALKPYMGHTLGGCGLNEMVLLLFAMEADFIPATLGFKEPLENISFVPLQEHCIHQKTSSILLNYVAFGGNNSVIILSNKG